MKVSDAAKAAAVMPSKGAVGMNFTRIEKVERVVFLVAIIVLLLDVLYWRPN